MRHQVVVGLDVAAFSASATTTAAAMRPTSSKRLPSMTFTFIAGLPPHAIAQYVFRRVLQRFARVHTDGSVQTPRALSAIRSNLNQASAFHPAETRWQCCCTLTERGRPNAPA